MAMATRCSMSFVSTATSAEDAVPKLTSFIDPQVDLSDLSSSIPAQ
jgi:hypothetical protein